MEAMVNGLTTSAYTLIQAIVVGLAAVFGGGSGIRLIIGGMAEQQVKKAWSQIAYSGVGLGLVFGAPVIVNELRTWMGV